MPKHRQTKAMILTAGLLFATAACSRGATTEVGSGTPAPNASEAPPTSRSTPDVVENRTPEEKARDRANLPPDMRAGMDKWQADIAAGKIPVSGPQGFVGYISKTAYSAPPPKTKADLFPVVNDAGAVVAYWGGGIVGVVDKSLVESDKPIDFAQMERSHVVGTQAPPAMPNPATSVTTTRG